VSGLLLGAGFRIGSQYTVRAKYTAIGLDRAVRRGILLLSKGYCSYTLWRGTPMTGFVKTELEYRSDCLITYEYDVEAQRKSRFIGGGFMPRQHACGSATWP